MPLNDEGLIVLDKRTELLPYKPRPFVQREYLTDAELTANAGGTLFLNCEVYPNYFLITFKLHTTGKFVELECGEGRSFNPQFLSWLMHSYRTVGFNSLSFDLLILWMAYHYQDASLLKDATNDFVSGMREWELKRNYGFQVFKTNHIDLIEVAPLKGSLRLYGARLHTRSIQDQPFDINADLTEFEIGEIKKFNCNQLDITEELFDFMKERIELREVIGNEYREDLRSKSDAQMAEIVLSKEISRLNGKQIERPDIKSGSFYYYQCPDFLKFTTPVLQNFLEVCKKAKFVINQSGYLDAPKEIAVEIPIGNMRYSFGIGGLHSTEKNVAYKATETKKLTDRDATSFYPNCIINLGLYPISAGESFLTVFRGFKDSRVEAKRAKNFTKDKGLKIFLNGTSGKFSDLWSKLRSPHLTMQMNLTCQLSILMLIEMLTQNGLEVVSANTDGIVIYHDRTDQEKLDGIIKAWEQQTKFDTEETEYKSYYARDVNSYFAVKLDGLIKKKGSWSEVGSQSGTKLDTNPIVLICSDAVEKLLADEVPIEETILNCKDFTRFISVRQAKAPGAHKNREYLGRVLRWYYAKGELGCIQTVQTGNKVADTDGAKPCMELPESFPEDIDYDWYIRHTKGILEDIGYSPRAKQIEFF